MCKSVFFVVLISCAIGCEGQLDLSGAHNETDKDRIVGGNPTNPEDPQNATASFHRLNRLEYNNSVRELLGVSLRPADAFPPDVSIGGFDNIASTLNISPSLFDAYTVAARTVVENAMGVFPSYDVVIESDAFTYAAPGALQRVGEFVRLRGASGTVSFEIETAGTYVMSVDLGGVRIGSAAPPVVEFQVDGMRIDAPTLDNTTTAAPLVYTREFTVGVHSVTLSPTNYINDAAANIANDILVRRLSIKSNVSVDGPGRALLVCDLDVAGCSTSILERFAYRAWRRPVPASDVEALTALYLRLNDAGEPPEEALKLSMRAILTSAKFLYRYRAFTDKDSTTSLDAFVLASKLSYFIWSSTPDDRLLQAASDGVLLLPEGLSSTIEWMLVDEKSVALADGFGEQWLDLRNLKNASPSPDVYGKFNEQIRWSMMQESKLFLLDFLNNGEPIARMLNPAFTYLDGTLTEHYNGVVGPKDFERVTAVDGDRRGILALSAWLTSRSDAEHASPIRRGSWLADNVLCTPVLPPPAGLEIGELPEGNGELSVRQQLELHRADAVCAGCHQALDIVGMGYQVYDGIGRYMPDPAIDSEGEIPGGPTFRGADEMAMNMDRNQFVGCVSEKLLIYALGRGLNTTDRAWLETIVSDQITLPELIDQIAQSDAFRMPIPLNTQKEIR